MRFPLSIIQFRSLDSYLALIRFNCGQVGLEFDAAFRNQRPVVLSGLELRAQVDARVQCKLQVCDKLLC